MAGNGRHNPLTSEAEAFRWLVVIVAGAATVIVVALIFGSLVGSLWALFLVGLGIGYLWREHRRVDDSSAEETRGGDGRYRVLLLANQTVRSPALLIAALEATEGRNSEILLVVPALVSGRPGLGASVTAAASSETDATAEHARQRMELTLQDLKQAGRKAKGRVMGSAPSQALRDALADFAADAIIVSTLPRERSHWLEQGVVERARIETDIPIRHVIWDDETAVSKPGDA